MRIFLNAALIAAAIGFGAAQVLAAPAGLAAPPGAAIPTPGQVILADGYYVGGYSPFCPRASHYACWWEPYGSRFCGCWPGGDRPACPQGYFYDCRYGPDGYGFCACY
jgi:hypothetical protein